jgi:hypothetical protein
MVTGGEIMAFAGSLKSAGDIVGSLISLQIKGEVQAKIVQLQTIILSAQQDAFSAQQSQFALVSKVRELEEEIARLKGIGILKERYELSEVCRGAYAYKLKPEEKGSDPAHWLCVQCFDGGQKSILQISDTKGRPIDNKYQCQKCNSSIIVYNNVRPS